MKAGEMDEGCRETGCIVRREGVEEAESIKHIFILL